MLKHIYKNPFINDDDRELLVKEINLASIEIIKECFKNNSAMTKSIWNASFENLKNKTSEDEESSSKFELGELTKIL